MSGLNQIGVPTHFIRRINMREQLVRMAEIIPLEVVVRNFSAGPMTARLGIPEGTQLPRPIVEYYFKDDKLGSPLVSEEHIVAFGWANQQDLDDIIALALRVNDFLSGVMMGVGIRLADFRIEIGRIWEGDFMRLIVADEISPDSCRLWDMRQPERPDGIGARSAADGRCLYRTCPPAGGHALERHPRDEADADQLTTGHKILRRRILPRLAPCPVLRYGPGNPKTRRPR
jgi:phosphoribosylaminoimidazole-succinocarboxamide synthase